MTRKILFSRTDLSKINKIYVITLGNSQPAKSSKYTYFIIGQDSLCPLAEPYLHHRKQLLLRQNNSCSTITIAAQAITITAQLKQ